MKRGGLATIPPPAKRRNGAWLLAPIAWMGLICASSCRVIHRDPFIAWVARRLPPDGAARGVWTHLWMAGGLAVVKGWHMTEYALLCALAFFALRRARPRMTARRAAGACLLLCATFAASDEWHQTFVVGRGGTPTDVAIDMAGATLAALALTRAAARRERRARAEAETTYSGTTP